MKQIAAVGSGVFALKVGDEVVVNSRAQPKYLHGVRGTLIADLGGKGYKRKWRLRVHPEDRAKGGIYVNLAGHLEMWAIGLVKTG